MGALETRHILWEACQDQAPILVVMSTLLSCACVTMASLSLVTILSFDSCTLSKIFTQLYSPYVFSTTTGSLYLSAGGVGSFSAISLALVSLSWRRIHLF